MNPLAIRPPQTLAAVVAKVHNSERVSAVLRELGAAIESDPTLRAVRHTALLAGWGTEETASYMILCLKARAENAEKRVLELLHRTAPVYAVLPTPVRADWGMAE